jgi:hypothetical protein
VLESDASLPRRIRELPALVLVLGNGIAAWAALRWLSRKGLRPFVVDEAPYLVRSSLHFRGLSGPPEGHQASPEAFGAWLDQNGFDKVVLLPCSDNWLESVSTVREALPERILASVPPPADLHHLDDAFLEGAFLKPTRSQDFYHTFHRKDVRVRDRADARDWLRRIAEVGHQAMLQELVPGPPENQVCLDGFVWADGSIPGLFARRWLRKYPDEFSESSLAVSIDLQEVEGAAATVRRMVSLLSLRGMFSVELKRDLRNGECRVLEINARAWWWVGFTCRCGLDVWDLALRDVLGDPIPPVDRYDVGRYCAYPSRDWYSYRALPHEEWEGYSTLVRRWIQATQPVFTLRDPWPAIVESRDRIARRVPRWPGRTGRNP